MYLLLIRDSGKLVSLPMNYHLRIFGMSFLLTKCIAAIEERKKYYEIRIGFIGGTGTGKSSLINALLMMNVLPENQEIASTAVPVEVSYNNDDDPAHLFIAVIEGMSMMDIAKELQQLYDDWILWKSGPDGEDDLPDVEVYERMNNTVEKFKWVFPNLQKIEDLSKTSAEELLKKQHVRKILDNKIYVQEPTESTFATAIQKYIESSKPNSEDEEAIAFWPLVKVVRIYVKAEILRNGIILVDLPGSHDTSAARVAVADNYRKNLTASVVCANADRAGSDKIAQDLLTSVERRNMQLDGLYKSDSLFFVVTKIDRLEYEKYIRDHKNLQQANQQDMKSIVSMKKEIEKLQGELEKGEEKKSRAERDSAKKKVNRDRLHGQVEKILGLAPSRKKRKSLNVTGMSINCIIKILLLKLHSISEISS
jgi:predicted GTPase